MIGNFRNQGHSAPPNFVESRDLNVNLEIEQLVKFPSLISFKELVNVILKDPAELMSDTACKNTMRASEPRW